MIKTVTNQDVEKFILQKYGQDAEITMLNKYVLRTNELCLWICIVQPTPKGISLNITVTASYIPRGWVLQLHEQVLQAVQSNR